MAATSSIAGQSESSATGLGLDVQTGDGSVHLLPLIILAALGVGMIANSYGEINRVYKYLERNKSRDRAERSPEEQRIRLAVLQI